MHIKKNILMTLLISLFLPSLSCMNLTQPSPEITYYTLEYDSPAYPGKKQLPFIIKLENFKISPLYDTTGIIYRKAAFERKAYTYHRWMVNPAEIVTYLFGRDLKDSGLFKGVMLQGDRSKDVGFRIEGMIDEFYELDGDRQWSGILSLSINMTPEGTAKSSGAGILQKTYRVSEICEKKNPEALAEALSRAMEKISRQLIDDIYTFISQKMKS